MTNTFTSSLRGVHGHHRHVTNIYLTSHLSFKRGQRKECTLNSANCLSNFLNITHQYRGRSLVCTAQPSIANSAVAAAASDNGAGQDPPSLLYGDEDAPFLQGRMQRIVRQIAVFGLPALMVPLADPSKLI